MRYFFLTVATAVLVLVSSCVDNQNNQSNGTFSFAGPTISNDLKQTASQLPPPPPVGGCLYSDGTRCNNFCCSTASTCGTNAVAWRTCDLQSGIWGNVLYADLNCQALCAVQKPTQAQKEANTYPQKQVESPTTISHSSSYNLSNWSKGNNSASSAQWHPNLTINLNQSQQVSQDYTNQLQNTSLNFTASIGQIRQVNFTNLQSTSLSLYFIDVGQGDAIVIQATNATHRNTLLIDSGDSYHSSSLIMFMQQLGISNLNVLMSHPDNDHMGGMANIVNVFNVTLFISNGESKDTSAYSNLMRALQNKNVPEWHVTAGNSFELVSGVGVTILNPPKQFFYDVNENSVVAKISIGKICALFTGDMENEAENYILSANYNITCPILKVAHHGSKSSSSYAFLKVVQPEVAVISVGADNSYGHPHQETITHLVQAGTKAIYRTDLSGTVTITTNGTTYTVTTRSPPPALPPTQEVVQINASTGISAPPQAQTPTQTNSTVFISYANYNAGGPYVNDNDVLTDEYVIVENGGTGLANLSAWTLSDIVGHIYYFPSNFVLLSNANVIVHTGVGFNNQTDLFWNRGSAVWNNDHDTAYLKDSAGNLISTKDW